MKIYQTKPRNHWLSPYTIAQTICFWRDIDYDEPWVERFVTMVEPVSIAIRRVLDFVHPEVNYVKIDHWDTWSMDHALSPIILPMLKQLQSHKHGAPLVDDSDVPARLHSTTRSAQRVKKNSWDTDGNHFKRWDYVLDEMIWAFTQLCDPDHDARFFSGTADFEWEEVNPEETDKRKRLWKLKEGPNHTHKFDRKGYEAHCKRISNGTRLFGKYYQSLWD